MIMGCLTSVVFVSTAQIAIIVFFSVTNTFSHPFQGAHRSTSKTFNPYCQIIIVVHRVPLLFLYHLANIFKAPVLQKPHEESIPPPISDSQRKNKQLKQIRNHLPQIYWGFCRVNKEERRAYVPFRQICALFFEQTSPSVVHVSGLG